MTSELEPGRVARSPITRPAGERDASDVDEGGDASSCSPAGVSSTAETRAAAARDASRGPEGLETCRDVERNACSSSPAWRSLRAWRWAVLVREHPDVIEQRPELRRSYRRAQRHALSAVLRVAIERTAPHHAAARSLRSFLEAASSRAAWRGLSETASAASSVQPGKSGERSELL